MQTEKQLIDNLVVQIEKGRIGDANSEELMAAFCKKEDVNLVKDQIESIRVHDMDMDVLIYRIFELKKNCGDKYARISFDLEPDEYVDNYILVCYGWRQENEYEAKKRIKKEMLDNEARYQQYLELKKEFEK